MRRLAGLAVIPLAVTLAFASPQEDVDALFAAGIPCPVHRERPQSFPTDGVTPRTGAAVPSVRMTKGTTLSGSCRNTVSVSVTTPVDQSALALCNISSESGELGRPP